MKTVFDRRLVTNTAWMLSSHGGRYLLQAVYFVLLARALGVTELGRFAGVLAAALIVAPFAGLGTGNLVVMATARDERAFPARFGNALSMTVLSGLALTILAALILPLLLPVSTTLVVLVALAELIFVRLADLCALAYQAFQRLSGTATVFMALTVARLLAVVGFIRWSGGGAEEWAPWYLAAASAVGVAGLLVTVRTFGRPGLERGALADDVRRGLPFSLGLAATSVSGDIDKTLLAARDTLTATGVYTAGYRVAALGYAPIRALLAATYARFFAEGARGLRRSTELARGIAPLVIGYGVVAAAVLFVAAPLVVWALGADYAESVGAIRLLALLPLLLGLHGLVGDALTGAGYQSRRGLVDAGAAIGNAALTLALIGPLSWTGAGVATLVTELGAVTALFWVLRRTMQQEVET